MDEHLEINVHEVRQICALSYVVIFDASIDLVRSQNEVEVLAVSVRWGDDTLTERAVNSIRRGIRAVLQPLGLGAGVRISNLVLHTTDFSEGKFEEFTVQYLQRAMGGPMCPPQLP